MNTDGNRLWSIQWSILCTVASHTPFTYTCLVWQKSIWQVGRVHDIWVFLSITSMSCLHWMLKTVYLHVNFYSEAGAFAFVHTETQQSEALNSFFLILVYLFSLYTLWMPCLLCYYIPCHRDAEIQNTERLLTRCLPKPLTFWLMWGEWPQDISIIPQSLYY